MHVQIMGMKVRSGEQVNNYKKKHQQKYSYFYPPPPYILGGETRGSFLGCDKLHTQLNNKTKRIQLYQT